MYYVANGPESEMPNTVVVVGEEVLQASELGLGILDVGVWVPGSRLLITVLGLAGALAPSS